MVRFSARGAYLLLVPQGKAPIRDRALISVLRNNRMYKPNLEEQITRFYELCIQMDIIVEKLRRRTLFCNAALLRKMSLRLKRTLTQLKR